MRFVLVTHEPIAENMSGPAIRVVEMARALTGGADCCIATPYPVTRALPPGVTGATYRFGDEGSLRRIVAGAGAVLIQGFTLHKFRFLDTLDVPLIVDLYCPFQLENLERMRLVGAPTGDRQAVAAFDLRALVEQLRRGDFFLCANDRQRDLWIGMLMALGRVAPSVYAADPDLRRLIDVVPFGLPADLPEHSSESFRASLPLVRPDDPLIMWGGSVLEWQDPVTLVEAMARVVRHVPNARLVFPGGAHPNPEIPAMPVVERTRERAKSLGLLDLHVLFTPWVPYNRRADYLLEASVGVSAHRVTLETRYAWRTRMLDYVWAALPIVCTRGDAFGDLVADRGLGAAVPAGDADAMADALVRLLRDADAARACRVRLEALRGELIWPRVVDPLRRFLQSPHRASRKYVMGEESATDKDARRPERSALGPTVRRLRRLINGALRG